MAHRRPRQKDFVGKTIQAAYTNADNIIRLWFTDGTAIAIEAETFTLAVCDECVGECPVPKPKKTKTRVPPKDRVSELLIEGRMLRAGVEERLRVMQIPTPEDLASRAK